MKNICYTIQNYCSPLQVSKKSYKWNCSADNSYSHSTHCFIQGSQARTVWEPKWNKPVQILTCISYFCINTFASFTMFPVPWRALPGTPTARRGGAARRGPLPQPPLLLHHSGFWLCAQLHRDSQRTHNHQLLPTACVLPLGFSGGPDTLYHQVHWKISTHYHINYNLYLTIHHTWYTRVNWTEWLREWR